MYCCRCRCRCCFLLSWSAAACARARRLCASIDEHTRTHRARSVVAAVYDAPTAQAACCGFDLCYKYIWYLVFGICHGRSRRGGDGGTHIRMGCERECIDVWGATEQCLTVSPAARAGRSCISRRATCSVSKLLSRRHALPPPPPPPPPPRREMGSAGAGAQSLMIRDTCFCLEYARGPIASLMPFGLSDSIFSTWDWVSVFRCLKVYGKFQIPYMCKWCFLGK